MLKKAVVSVMFALLCAARTASAEIVPVFGEAGVNDSTSGGWNELLTVSGQVNKFNVAGATLLSYTVFGDVRLTFSGEFGLINPAEGGGATVNGLVGVPTMLNGPFPLLSLQGTELCDATDTCGAIYTIPINIPVADLASVIGPGTMDVNASGFVEIFSSFNLNLLSASATLSILNLRWEGAYCVSDETIDCAADYPNNPVVPTTSVPEPGVLGLIGLALAGLGFARRRRLTS